MLRTTEMNQWCAFRLKGMNILPINMLLSLNSWCHSTRISKIKDFLENIISYDEKMNLDEFFLAQALSLVHDKDDYKCIFDMIFFS